MTQLEETLTKNLTEMMAMHKKELEAYEESLKTIVEDLGQSYKQHMQAEQEEEQNEDENLLNYIKRLTEQNQEIITLLKKPPQADGVAMQLQPIFKDFFQNLERKLITSNQALIEEMKDSLQSLSR